MNISITLGNDTWWSTWSWHIGRFEPDELGEADDVTGHADLELDQPVTAVQLGFRTTPPIG
jgi:hypothetical protein